MPVNILLTFIIGSALGWILVKITRTPQHMHGLVIGCCSAGTREKYTYIYTIYIYTKPSFEFLVGVFLMFCWYRKFGELASHYYTSCVRREQ